MTSRRSSKRAFVEFFDGNVDDAEVYRFQILLPNGTTTRLMLCDPAEEMFIDEFIHVIRNEVEKTSKTNYETRRKIHWSESYLEDLCDKKIKEKIRFSLFKTNKCHILRLQDGEKSVNTFQNMWDLTPDTELLAELPAAYTFETALADLIDNSLQALWSNGPEERRLVSVAVDEQKIVIFDTGPGMDGSDEKSISKWGKMGLSDHRLSRKLAVGGNAPYLTPFFGMFGYGGPIASMHLGRHAVVSSKTKHSRKVYTLHLSRDALLNKSGPKLSWRTDGGIRDPLDEEIKISPHGSFTQVEIHDPKTNSVEIYNLQCLLKDIYFPYIQCDEVLSSRKTVMPIEFHVNGVNLAEIAGGEVAVTNLHSCNGPEFVFQLSLLSIEDNSLKTPGPKVYRKANARVKCVYFPIVQGKENIDRILEKLNEDGCRIEDNFESFSRVSIRRLGRLLPDARWRGLPFMEPKLRKGEKAELLKRCCLRVKCFVETDAGFSPTPSKTDLANHDLFTMALRNLGSRISEKKSEAAVEIYKDGKLFSILQLEKEYRDWIIRMHDSYDEEIDCGVDEPIVIIGPQNKKKLGISSDVVRVHRAIRRAGILWKSGQKVKILKGAVGCTKNNLYATLEYILLEGFQGDVGGEARLLCRPLGCSDDRSCSIAMTGGNAILQVHDSLSFPISVIDSGKFQAIDKDTWNIQLEKRKQKEPSTIDILSHKYCCQIGIEEELPLGVPVDAGYKPPNEIVAVIRPANFISTSSSSSLDQKYVLKSDLEMSVDVRLLNKAKGKGDEYIFAERVKPSSRHGLHGLYIFSLQSRPNLFYEAGVYSFTFSLIYKDSSCKREIRVEVRPASSRGIWRFLFNEHDLLKAKSSVFARAGLCVSDLSVACFDPYSNQITFSNVPEAKIDLCTDSLVLVHVEKVKLILSPDRLSLKIKDLLIESTDLDKIRPEYEATLKLCSLDAKFSAAVHCRVMPGPVSIVKMLCPPVLEKCLTPGYIIDYLLLEALDAYGNHIEEGIELSIKLDGLCFEDHGSSLRKVNERGYVDLSGLLKVTASYGAKVLLYASVGEKIIFKQMFQVGKRELRAISFVLEKELRAVSKVPTYCIAGSLLENVVFEVFDSDGVVDEEIHGRHHTLAITSESLNVGDTIQYTFQHGRCIVPVISVPHEQGVIRLLATHTDYPDLQTSIEIFVLQAPKLELTPVTESDTGTSQYQSPDKRILLLQDSSPGTPSQMDMLEFIMDDARILQETIAAVGLRIRDHESNLKLLNYQKSEIAQEICDLQDRIGPQYLSYSDMLVNTKEHMVQEIVRRGNTAAAVFCNLKKTIPMQDFEKNSMEDFIGIVALLGTVSDSKLSRILSQYLGEDYMLAIVCKSIDGAFSLEKYDEYGNIKRNCALHEAAAKQDKMINGRFPVICLEEIRPYTGKLISKDPQRKLVLPYPLHSGTGKIPRGFVGYAVNMVNIDINHLKTRTTQGYGLRETLLYQLLGEVQVYATRTDMQLARTCINQGAVSLDGGIMRDKGLYFLGDWEPAVRFPVIPAQVQRELSCHLIDIIKQIEDKKATSEVIDRKIQEAAEAWSKDKAKFKRKSERLQKKLGGRPFRNLLECSPLQKTK